MKKIFMMLVLLFVLLFSIGVAEEARVLNDEVTFSATKNSEKLFRMLDQKYNTCFHVTNQKIVIDLKGQTCGGIYLTFLSEPTTLMIEEKNQEGVWQVNTYFDAKYKNQYIKLSLSKSTTHLRIGAKEENAELKINSFYLLSEGTLPSFVQTWETLDTPADIMQIVTHPDDDILWFAGLLPLYAGEKEKKVMVVYTVGQCKESRKNELLDGLWTCKVKYYPEIGPFKDLNSKNKKTVIYRMGGKDKMPLYVTTMLRKHRPSVVVTQALNGEYGHLQHIVTVEGVVNAVTKHVHDVQYQTPAFNEPFQVKKLYVHAYKNNQIHMDYTKKLDHFQGQTAFEIAKSAFKKHVSQQKTHYKVRLDGAFKPTVLGLYYSTVGDDVLKNDILEHIE